VFKGRKITLAVWVVAAFYVVVILVGVAIAQKTNPRTPSPDITAIGEERGQAVVAADGSGQER
jgi:hypothetical protein